MTSPSEPAVPTKADLIAMSEAMTKEPLATDDFMAVETAVQELYQSILVRADPDQPWSPSNRATMKALVIAGEYRSGKSYALKKALARLKPLPLGDEVVEPNNLMIDVSSVTTIEDMARDMMAPMRLLPPKRLGPSGTVTALRNRVKLRKPTLYALDEAQFLLKHDRVAEARQPEHQTKTLGVFRGLMDLKEWPLGIILCGNQALMPVLEREENAFFSDRKRLIFMRPLTIGNDDDRGELKEALESFASTVSFHVNVKGTSQFFDRLMHATNRARGLAFEVCKEAILVAAATGSKVVEPEHFATFYARKTGNDLSANPFKTEAWQKVNSRSLAMKMAGSTLRIGESPKPVVAVDAKKRS